MLSVDNASPVGMRGALTAGVLWLLEERIVILGGRRRKSPDRFSFISWPKAGISLTGGFLTLYRSAAQAERM